MRRLTTLLVLLAAGGAHLTAPVCPVAAPGFGASAEQSPAGHHGAAAHHGTVAHHDAEQSPHHGGRDDGGVDPTDHGGGADCRLLMVCGGAVLGVRPEAGVAAPPLRGDAARPAAMDPTSTPIRTQDPPPPRLPV